MNVSSATPTTSTQPTNTTSSTQNTAKTQGKNSFDEELKNVETENSQEQEVQSETQNQAEETAQQETSDNETSQQQNNQQTNSQTEVDAIDEKLSSADLLSLNIKSLLDTQNELTHLNKTFKLSISTNEDLTKSIGETLNYTSVEMSENDANFFVDLVQKNETNVQNIVQEVQQAMDFGTEQVQKTATVSKTLLNALQNSVKTGQAVRIDFGNDVSVVMRITRDGSIMANFIPGDKAVEEYLKNNIGFLKQRFDEEDIPYSQLSYSQNQQQQRREQQNKENRHE